MARDVGGPGYEWREMLSLVGTTGMNDAIILALLALECRPPHPPLLTINVTHFTLLLFIINSQ